MCEDSQQGPDSTYVGSQPCPIRRAVGLIEANFAARLSREEMARAAGLSVSYFSKLFTHCIGLSPHQYLVRCRLRHGKKLLATPEENLPIVDVAAEAGFADQAHFCRHFRRACGTSRWHSGAMPSCESENLVNPRVSNRLFIFETLAISLSQVNGMSNHSTVRKIPVYV